MFNVGICVTYAVVPILLLTAGKCSHVAYLMACAVMQAIGVRTMFGIYERAKCVPRMGHLSPAKRRLRRKEWLQCYKNEHLDVISFYSLAPRPIKAFAERLLPHATRMDAYGRYGLWLQLL